MFLKTRGYLQNKWGSTSVDELLADQKAKIEAAAPVFLQWANGAQAIHERVQAVSEAPDFAYDQGRASTFADTVRNILTNKGTSFELDRKKEAILFPKGTKAPEISLNTLNEIAQGLEIAAVRIDMNDDATDAQREALAEARQSFAAVLEHFQSVIDHGEAAIASPAISGAKDDPSLKARARDAMVRDLRYTILAHRTLSGKVASRAGLHNTGSGPGADASLENAEPAT